MPIPSPLAQTDLAKPKLLCVDDEPNVLSGLRLQLRKHFEVDTAGGGADGLAKLEADGRFAVVVSDMRMPVMDGATFLARVREGWPDTTRVLLTGQSGIEEATKAINEGRIFRFLTKPCAPDSLREHCLAAAEQHRLLTAEKDLLEKTLRGSVSMLGGILALSNPTAFSCGTRVRRLVRRLLPPETDCSHWEIDIAAMLSQIGLVSLPEEVIARKLRGGALSNAERDMWSRHPRVARDMLADIPRLQNVAESIGLQAASYSSPGAGVPAGADLPLGARLLKVAIDYDRAVMLGDDPCEAVAELRGRAEDYDPNLLSALEDRVCGGAVEFVIKRLPLKKLQVGMLLHAPVQTKGGLMLISKGQEITPTLLYRLENFARSGTIEPTVQVALPVEEPQGAPQ